MPTVPFGSILLIALIAGPIGGIISLYVGGALLHFSGKWIGGVAPTRHIRTAIAWSMVPLVFRLILWVIELLLFGEELFTTSTSRIEQSEILWMMLLGFSVLDIILAIWTIVLFLKCLGEVQGFSAWKAFGNTILAFLVVFVPLIVVIFVVIGIT